MSRNTSSTRSIRMLSTIKRKADNRPVLAAFIGLGAAIIANYVAIFHLKQLSQIDQFYIMILVLILEIQLAKGLFSTLRKRDFIEISKDLGIIAKSVSRNDDTDSALKEIADSTSETKEKITKVDEHRGLKPNGTKSCAKQPSGMHKL